VTLTINEATTQYGQPVGADQRFWLRIEATAHEAGRLAYFLASESIEFTFDPYPDGEFEFTTKPDQERSIRKWLAYVDGQVEKND
jgi:hypothetical protein